MSTESLALFGGPKAVTAAAVPYRRYGEAELAQVREAFDQGSLFYAHGMKVKTLCERFAALHGRKHCIAASSCTAAIHAAVASLGLEPGDEIITSPITDMGTVLGMLWCQLVPVFADLDLRMHTLDPVSVEACITPRTRAIVPVHLGGTPCKMAELQAIAERHNLRIIEDCAQSFLAEYRGSYVGSFSDLACFSINEYKHISCGDGGLILTDDDDLAARCRMLVDKGYDRTGAGRNRMTPFLCLNYRMTELQGAVALAQLEKLPEIVKHYEEMFDILHYHLQDVYGLILPVVPSLNRTSAWFYMLLVDEEMLGVSRDWFAQALQAEGVAAYPYIPTPVYRCGVFADRATLGASGMPFSLPGVEVGNRYDEGTCPQAEEILRTCLVISMNMGQSRQLMEETAAAFRKVARHAKSAGG